MKPFQFEVILDNNKVEKKEKLLIKFYISPRYVISYDFQAITSSL
jgi:hypothetical protein